MNTYIVTLADGETTEEVRAESMIENEGKLLFWDGEEWSSGIVAIYKEGRWVSAINKSASPDWDEPAEKPVAEEKPTDSEKRDANVGDGGLDYWGISAPFRWNPE